METISIPQTDRTTIQWKQLWSLAALYASVIIGWIAYYRYQPKLLVQYGFTDFSFLLIVAQAIILVVTPPIAGRLGDKFRFKAGHRLPIISSGISFAAMIFMAVAFTLFTNPGEIFKWVLPVMIIGWLIGMSIFTSPALSTVELFAPVDKLPRAMAVLTIVSNLISALEPVIVDIIDYLGAPVTFMVGGVAVFLSGYALRKNSLDLFKAGGGEATGDDGVKTNYLRIFLMGIAVGIASTMLFNIFPDKLQASLGSWTGLENGNLMIVMMLVLSAIVSLPASSWVNKWGLEQSFLMSLVVVLISIPGVIYGTNIILIMAAATLFAVMLSVLSVSALPLVIRQSSLKEKVLGVGIFFSGTALPDGIVEIVMV